jgi:hypothetical protein
MAGELLYCRSDQTTLITPDALRVRFRQSSFPAQMERRGDGWIVTIADDVELSLKLNSGFVESIDVHAKFVGKGSRIRRVCELLETMGWVQAERPRG